MASLDEDVGVGWRTFCSPDIEAGLPDGIKATLREKWNGHIQEVESQIREVEKEKVASEQQCLHLECDLNNVRQKLETQLLENEDNNQQGREIRDKYGEAKLKLTSLEETNATVSFENGSLRRERDQLASERGELADLAQRRQAEVERLAEQWKTLGEQLAAANNAKCEALVRAEDIQSREVSLEYREKRMAEERNFLNKQVATLTNELDTKNEEIIQVRSQQSQRLAGLQADLSGKTEELRIRDTRQEAADTDLKQTRKQLERLNTRLKEAREAEIKMEENFKQEIRAQAKMAQLYKNNFEDSQSRTTELEQAVEKFQEMLKQSTEQYGIVEQKLVTTETNQKEEIDKRNEAIRALKKELEDSNGLIKMLQTKGLSEEGIASLSPSAAAASKLLKSGVTLTQIYSQLVAVQDELLEARAEKRNAEMYLEQILKEVEERAPQLKAERDQYERAQAANSILEQQLEEVRGESRDKMREADEAKRRAAQANKDNERLALQVKDLSKQVVVLLREVETVRSLRSVRGVGVATAVVQPQSPPTGATDAESVITDRLSTFRSVSDLQEKHAQLLGVVRELSANREQQEERVVAENTQALRQQLRAATERIEELRSARERQEAMVENIIHQRDMYKSMAAYAGASSQSDDRLQQQQREAAAAAASVVGPVTSTPSAASAPLPPPQQQQQKTASPSPRKGLTEAEKRAVEAEAAHKELQKEFDTYRTEKCENERLINAQLEKVRDELSESRRTAAKLSSQEEYNTERFKIVKDNASAYKRQLTLLEDRNRKLNTIVEKHEASIESLKTEAMTAQSQLSRSEVRLQQMTHERNLYKSAEARLVQEREVLRRERSGSALVMENLKQIQLNLERTEEETKMRLQNQNESLGKEVTLLRKKIDSEEENYRASVKAWEKGQQELRAKMEEAQSGQQQAAEKVQTAERLAEELRMQLKESQEKLELAETKLAGRGGPAGQAGGAARQMSTQENSQKMRDLELLVNQSKNEAKNLKEQLDSSRSALSQYKEIAESAEKRLTEGNNATKIFKEDLERRLSEALGANEALGQKLQAAEEERRQLADSSSKQTVSQHATDATLRDQLRDSQEQLSAALESLAEARRIEAEARQAAIQQSSAANEVQQKYERELLLHAQTVEALNAVKSSVTYKRNQCEELEEAKQKTDEEVKEMKEKLEALQRKGKAEAEAVKEELEVVQKQNNSLHEQLKTVTQQMASLQSQMEGNPDANKSFSEEDSKSSDQLMQIIKYLRREKEILASKVDLVGAECARVKSQLEQSLKQGEEQKAALTEERERQGTEAQSASRHFELLEKVQTMSALSDSNRLMRNERDQLALQLEETKAKLSEVNAGMEPLQEKLRLLEEKDNANMAELLSLKGECNNWKKRSLQLIEKNQKVNPDELKRVQDSNVQLTRTVAQLTSQLRSTQTVAKTVQAKAKDTEDKLTTDVKKKEEEIAKLTADNQKIKSAYSQANGKLNLHIKKLAESDNNIKQLTSEREILKQEVTKVRNELSNKAEEEVGQIKQELESKKVILQAKETEVEILKENLTKVKESQKTSAITINKLKTLGRSFKDKNENLEKEKKVMVEQKTQLDEELKSLKENVTASQKDGSHLESAEEYKKELEEAQGLISASEQQIAELEGRVKEYDNVKQQLEEVEKEKKELEQSAKDKQERSKTILTTAKNKITSLNEQVSKLQNENSELRSMKGFEKLPHTSEAAAALAQAQQTGQELDTLKAQHDILKAENENNKEAASENEAEKERLQQRVDLLEQQLEAHKKRHEEISKVPTVAEKSASVKPMAGTSAQRKPQTAVQSVPPTRHFEARPIRQRVTAAVLPTSQEIPQVLVQPIVSVSPSPSTSQPVASITATVPVASLNLEATLFTPRISATASAGAAVQIPTTVSIEPSEELTGLSAMASAAPRLEVAIEQAGPSTSTASCSRAASVMPTPKRPREFAAADVEDDVSKRVRTISTSEDAVTAMPAAARVRTVSTSEDAVTAAASREDRMPRHAPPPPLLPPPPTASSTTQEADDDDGGDDVLVESDDGEDGAEFEDYDEDAEDIVGVDDEDDEAVMEEEDGLGMNREHEVEEAPREEDDDSDLVVLDEEESTEQMESPGQSDDPPMVSSDAPDLSSAVAAALMTEANEPSSSSPARTSSSRLPMLRAEQSAISSRSTAPAFISRQQQVPTMGQFDDPGESDSVVPSTPKLIARGRPDGFAEAVSSPAQVPTDMSRFPFSSSGSGGGSPGHSLLSAAQSAAGSSSIGPGSGAGAAAASSGRHTTAAGGEVSSSSNSALVASQEALLDRTAMDIGAFAAAAAVTATPSGTGKAMTQSASSNQELQSPFSETVTSPLVDDSQDSREGHVVGGGGGRRGTVSTSESSATVVGSGGGAEADAPAAAPTSIAHALDVPAPILDSEFDDETSFMMEEVQSSQEYTLDDVPSHSGGEQSSSIGEVATSSHVSSGLGLGGSHQIATVSSAATIISSEPSTAFGAGHMTSAGRGFRGGSAQRGRIQRTPIVWDTQETPTPGTSSSGGGAGAASAPSTGVPLVPGSGGQGVSGGLLRTSSARGAPAARAAGKGGVAKRSRGKAPH